MLGDFSDLKYPRVIDGNSGLKSKLWNISCESDQTMRISITRASIKNFARGKNTGTACKGRHSFTGFTLTTTALVGLQDFSARREGGGYC